MEPPGSPLTYSPQLLMQQPHDVAGSPYGSRGTGAAVSDCHAVAGWPAQPKLVPTVIVCAPLLLFGHSLTLILIPTPSLRKPSAEAVRGSFEVVIGSHHGRRGC